MLKKVASTIAVLLFPLFQCFAADSLITMSNISYVGSFKTYETGQGGYAVMAYGGRSLAYNSTNDSLFIGGFHTTGYVAEIDITTPDTETSQALLDYTPFLQGPATGGGTNVWDITSGNVANFGAGGAACSYPTPYGLFVYAGGLLGAVTSSYDSAPVCSFLSHFTFNSTTLSSGTYDGMWGLYSSVSSEINARFMGGYMASIPATYQTQLGGPMLTGSDPASIATQSIGPTVSVFDPSSMGTKNTSTSESRGSCTVLIAYPNSHPTLTPVNGNWQDVNDYFSASDQVNGVVIPSNTRTIMFIGMHGKGAFCYGPLCTDPTNPGADGQHNYEDADHGYRDWVWLYDIGNSDGENTTGNTTPENGYSSGTMYNTATAVKLGIIDPWDIIPYYVGPLDLSPFESPSSGYSGAGQVRCITAAAINPTTNYLYISRYKGYEAAATPIIEVYYVSAGDVGAEIVSSGAMPILN